MIHKKFKKISVIGLGYIGLPTAAVFASRQIEVVGVDVNKNAVETINSGRIHIVEPDLDIAVHTTVTSGFLRASTVAEPAEAFLIAVPTPFRGENREPDLSYIESACASIAPVLKTGDLVVLESTSPVGATESMAKWLADARPDLTFPQQVGDASDIRIAHCPERVLPGQVMRELIENDRIIGGMTPACAALAVELYKSFVKGECITTDARTAEMAKLTENSFRDVNIAFANELSLICDKLDINVWELIRLANRHPRVNILQPGPGVGGHCIAVDPWFIVSSAPEQARLVRSAREVNDSKPHWVLGKIREACVGIGHRPRVACLGLAFKPNIDDLRESPALDIVEHLATAGFADILAVEPHIETVPARLAGKVEFVSAEDALARADLIVVLVDHAAFKLLTPPVDVPVIDTRGMWQAKSGH